MKIPLFKIYSDENDITAVNEIIRRGTYWATGDEISEFEKRLAEFNNLDYVVTFNSGTSALHSLLLAHNINGFEVIVPSFTFIATANSVLLAGGKPIFAEIEEETFGLDYKDVIKKITPRTKAIIPMHFGGGISKNILALKELARDKNLLLLEDAAQALGASWNSHKAGSFGDGAIFSFCQNKIITTGEGGAVGTNDRAIYEKLLLIRSHGRVEIAGVDYFSNIGDNDYIEAGFNFRMPTMNAALGISQLKKIEFLINQRRKIAKYFMDELKKIPLINFPIQFDNYINVFQLFTVLLPNKEIRDKLQLFLIEKGIMSKIYFEPIHLKTLYLNYGYLKGSLPKTEELANRVLTLPLFVSMTSDEAEWITKNIRLFFDNN